jgi:hypothetical protein
MVYLGVVESASGKGNWSAFVTTIKNPSFDTMQGIS